jgi:pimeloyl-ACP methyl ester carboxylesterase
LTRIFAWSWAVIRVYPRLFYLSFLPLRQQRRLRPVARADFLVTQPLGYELEHFSLALGECVQRIRPRARPAAGYLQGGLAYNRFGCGPRPLVLFQGLMFENKPQPARMLSMYHFLGEAYTVWAVLRRPGLPAGYTLKDMADDYAAMTREEFDGPVDVIGGSIAQHFAADHPDLLRKLVLHSAACSLSDDAKRLQWRLADLAREGCWREANELTILLLVFQLRCFSHSI